MVTCSHPYHASWRPCLGYPKILFENMLLRTAGGCGRYVRTGLKLKLRAAALSRNFRPSQTTRRPSVDQVRCSRWMRPLDVASQQLDPPAAQTSCAAARSHEARSSSGSCAESAGDTWQ